VAGLFGVPDGARSSIEEISRDFIDSFLDSHDIKKLSVIVGPKGSGKSTYIRVIQNRLQMDNSIYVDQVRYDLPATILIEAFFRKYPEDRQIEIWMQIWHSAILNSLITFI